MTDAFRERRFRAQDGLTLYYRDYGDPLSPAPPVLCLAGLTRNSRDFDDLATRLSSTRRVVALDYRGRGRSEHDPDWRNYAGPVYLSDIRHLLTAAGLHKVAVVGTSMGGLVAMAMGAALPTALAGVILNDVGPNIDDSGSQRILRYIAKDRPQPNWATAVQHLKDTLPFLSFDNERDWRRFAEGTYREGDDGQLHFDWDIDIVRPLLETDFEPPDYWALFRSLAGVPVLAIRGGLSDILTAETLHEMAAAHPDFTHITLPEVGHTPSLKEPDSLKAIDEFLARL